MLLLFWPGWQKPLYHLGICSWTIPCPLLAICIQQWMLPCCSGICPNAKWTFKAVYNPIDFAVPFSVTFLQPIAKPLEASLVALLNWAVEPDGSIWAGQIAENALLSLLFRLHGFFFVFLGKISLKCFWPHNEAALVIRRCNSARFQLLVFQD